MRIACLAGAVYAVALGGACGRADPLALSSVVVTDPAADGGGATAAVPDAGSANAGSPVDAGPASVTAGLPSGTCDAPPAGLRLLAPISGSTVTTSHPRLQFDAGLADRVDVQICRDRACTQPVWEQAVEGREVTPPDLPPGYWFWRARSITLAGDLGWRSAWLFRVRPRASDYAPAADTAAELFNDFNGDGYPDVIVQGAGAMTVYFGGPGALPPQPFFAGGAPSSGGALFGAPSVDLNGDGFTDYATLSRGDKLQPVGMVQIGSRAGLQPGSSHVDLFPAANPLPVDEAPVGVGDVDGDGFGDLVWSRHYGAYLIRGCSGGIAAGPWTSLPCDACLSATTVSGDLNGDGRWDVVSWAGNTSALDLGSTSPVSIDVGRRVPRLVVDLDGDGYSDLVATDADDCHTHFLFGGPTGISLDEQTAQIPPGVDAVGDFNGDGHWDIAFWASGTIRYGGPGPVATFVHSQQFPKASSGMVVDLNADSYDDLVLPGADGGLQFLPGSPDGLASDPVLIPGP